MHRLDNLLVTSPQHPHGAPPHPSASCREGTIGNECSSHEAGREGVPRMRTNQPRPTRKVYYSWTGKKGERVADQAPGLIVEGRTMDRPLNITDTEPARKHEHLHINSRQWAEPLLSHPLVTLVTLHLPPTGSTSACALPITGNFDSIEQSGSLGYRSTE